MLIVIIIIIIIIIIKHKCSKPTIKYKFQLNQSVSISFVIVWIKVAENDLLCSFPYNDMGIGGGITCSRKFIFITD